MCHGKNNRSSKSINSPVLTRRDFLKSTASAAVAGAFSLGRTDALFFQIEPKTRVVLIRNKDVISNEGAPRRYVLEAMLDEAVATLLGENDAKNAWRQIVKPRDIVGIKSNEWEHLPTPGELEITIKEKLLEAGVPENHISTGDRRILRDNIFLNATALINARPLRTHHWAGVGSLLKNYIMFIEEPSDYHPDSCADLAKIWKLPLVAGKTRLNILVALTPLFHGIGPHHFSRRYVWPYRGLLVGLDPVAVDAMGVRILQARRKEYFKEERPLAPPPKHIMLADSRHDLGTADPEKIELIKLGWQDGALI